MMFFVLEEQPIGEHGTEGMDALAADDAKYGEAPHCDNCGDYVGMRQWLPPFRVELELWGSTFPDLAVLSSDLLVSSRFKQAYLRSGLDGLSGFESVDIVKIKRRRKRIGVPPAYFRATVPLSQTAIDLGASDFEWSEEPTCPVCLLGDDLKRWKRVIIDQITWTGEDIFIARGLPGTIIVTEPFKDFYNQNDLTGAVFLPAESYAYDFYPGEK